MKLAKLVQSRTCIRTLRSSWSSRNSLHSRIRGILLTLASQSSLSFGHSVKLLRLLSVLILVTQWCSTETSISSGQEPGELQVEDFPSWFPERTPRLATIRHKS